MSYSKDFEAYPQEFATLLERGALEGLTLPLGTAENAKRLMGRLYAYKGALKKAAQDFDATEEIKALYQYSRKVQFRQEATCLVIRPLDQDPDALLIRAALDTSDLQATKPRDDGQILVPINPAHLPNWLAELAIKRAGGSGS